MGLRAIGGRAGRRWRGLAQYLEGGPCQSPMFDFVAGHVCRYSCRFIGSVHGLGVVVGLQGGRRSRQGGGRGMGGWLAPSGCGCGPLGLGQGGPGC
jgi:hypothetical protein